jgi:hypothetical protein
MATYNKFQDFVEQLGKGIHQLHAGGHLLKVFLTNEQPLVGDTLKSQIAEISTTYEVNHGAGGGDIQNDYSEAAGIASLTGVNVVFQATGGTVGPFKYTVIYNDSATSPLDALVAWHEYPGAAITLQDGESFTVKFGASICTIT